MQPTNCPTAGLRQAYALTPGGAVGCPWEELLAALDRQVCLGHFFSSRTGSLEQTDVYLLLWRAVKLLTGEI